MTENSPNLAHPDKVQWSLSRIKSEEAVTRNQRQRQGPVSVGEQGRITAREQPFEPAGASRPTPARRGQRVAAPKSREGGVDSRGNTPSGTTAK